KAGGLLEYACGQAGHRFISGFPAGCDPVNAASVAADSVFQQGFAQHVFNLPGNTGGPKYWAFDNEPSIWHAAYWDVHPLPAHDTEVRDKMLTYGAMIKAVYPAVKTLGPEEWGWDAFFYSGFDQQTLFECNFAC